MILKPFIKRFKLRNAKPFVLLLHFLMLFLMSNVELLGKNPSENGRAFAVAGVSARLARSRFVCVSVYPLFEHHENLRCGASVREKTKIIFKNKWLIF